MGETAHSLLLELAVNNNIMDDAESNMKMRNEVSMLFEYIST